MKNTYLSSIKMIAKHVDGKTAASSSVELKNYFFVFLPGRQGMTAAENTTDD
jgi:hypothetical protein